jgi:hypothetical protein
VQGDTRTDEYAQDDDDQGHAEGRGVPGAAKDHLGEDDGDCEADDATADSSDPHQHSRRSVSGPRRGRKRSDAWGSYATGSEVAHFAKFCREHLIQSEDRWEGKPLILEPWQQRMLGEALAFDSDGWPTWRG